MIKGMDMKIRSIAICWIEHNDHIFVHECYDPTKDQTFYRPLGGGIEFGETAKEAAKREFQEELKTDISVDDNYQVYENIFTFDGKPGHEIVFMLKAKFKDSSFYEQRDFIGDEGGTPFTAKWVHISEFTSGKRILYPDDFVNSLRSD
jgi:8-oxo-dGTP pyrophosphatase MutT (NUDIX family)